MISYPTYKEIVNRIRADVAANLPNTDPTIHGSYLRALADSLAGRAYDITLLVKQLENELFPQTASGEYLERWAGYEGISRKSATGSSGLVTFVGSLGLEIPPLTQFRGENSKIYQTTTTIEITSNTQSINSLTRLGTIATAETLSAHSLGSGMSVIIAGASKILNVSLLTSVGTTATATTTTNHNLESTPGVSVTIAGSEQPAYNGTYSVTVTGDTTFEYTFAGTEVSPAEGYITATYPLDAYNGTFEIAVESKTKFTYTLSGSPINPTNTGITVGHTSTPSTVESVDVGADTDLDSGAILSLVTPIGGESVTGYVQFDGLVDGADSETDVALLARVLQSRSNPVANFNVAAIEKLVLSVPGVTRVLVKRITPEVGDVTILFMRDNDTNPIPGAPEVQAVKDVVYPIVPAQSSTDYVYISAPTAVVQDFLFSGLNPDTPTMRTAINENLKAFFQDEVNFEIPVTADKYRAAIIDTIDPTNGDSLVSFDLVYPTSTIGVPDGGIAILGQINYPS